MNIVKLALALVVTTSSIIPKSGPTYRPANYGPAIVDGRQITMPLHPYPLSVNGRLLLDIDADDDGSTMFEGDAGDLSIAADGTLSLGYDKAGFGFSVELGNASVAFDGRRKLATFAAESGDGFFTGTPLSFIEGKNKTTVRGFFRSPDDFEISAKLKSSAIAGFAVRDTDVRLSKTGITVRGTAKLVGIGEVLVEGQIDSKGGFNLRGRADLTVAGFRMANADVTLGTSGVKIAGSVDLPGLGKARVSGHVKPNGQFALAGRATLAPAGLKLSNADVKIGSGGAMVAGSVNFLGSVFQVRGGANARGEFSLSGEISIKAVVLFGHVRLAISNRGASAAINGQACIGGCIDLPGMEINTNGTVCPTFPLIGRKCIKVLG